MVEVALAASVQLEPAVLAVEVVLTALVQLEPAVSVVEVAQAASVAELALAALEPAVSAVEVEQAASVVDVAPAALVQAAKAGLAKGQTATSPTGRSEGVNWFILALGRKPRSACAKRGLVRKTRRGYVSSAHERTAYRRDTPSRGQSA